MSGVHAMQAGHALLGSTAPRDLLTPRPALGGAIVPTPAGQSLESATKDTTARRFVCVPFEVVCVVIAPRVTGNTTDVMTTVP